MDHVLETFDDLADLEANLKECGVKTGVRKAIARMFKNKKFGSGEPDHTEA